MKCIQCHQCHNDTNEKDGLCVICRNPNKFGQRDIKPLPTPASKPSKVAKSNQRIKRGHTGSVLSQNPYLLDDLELLLNAQISHIFSLVKEGKLKLAAHRINLVQKELKNEALKNAKHKKHR